MHSLEKRAQFGGGELMNTESEQELDLRVKAESHARRQCRNSLPPRNTCNQCIEASICQFEVVARGKFKEAWDYSF
jgi:hypothetical protein